MARYRDGEAGIFTLVFENDEGDKQNEKTEEYVCGAFKCSSPVNRREDSKNKLYPKPKTFVAAFADYVVDIHDS